GLRCSSSRRTPASWSPLFTIDVKTGVLQAEGKKLGLVGWVQNTESGTVQGQLQGPKNKVRQMQDWLKSTGSPKSQIIKAEFKNEKNVESLDYSAFSIIRS
uniref:Acylphosphatase-1 n=1 Tax=Esox lucius TaxID=8010 RepID=A0AAY5KN12_ESOLU